MLAIHTELKAEEDSAMTSKQCNNFSVSATVCLWNTHFVKVAPSAVVACETVDLVSISQVPVSMLHLKLPSRMSLVQGTLQFVCPTGCNSRPRMQQESLHTLACREGLPFRE